MVESIEVGRLFRAGVKSVNARDWKAHRALLADSYRFVDYGNAMTLTSADDYVGYQEHSMTPFPDEQLTIKKLVVDGRVAIAELVAHGTHTQPLQLNAGADIPPTGKSFTLHIVCVAEYDETGKCRTSRVYHSPTELTRQLGLGRAIPHQITLEQSPAPSTRRS